MQYFLNLIQVLLTYNKVLSRSSETRARVVSGIKLMFYELQAQVFEPGRVPVSAIVPGSGRAGVLQNSV